MELSVLLCTLSTFSCSKLRIQMQIFDAAGSTLSSTLENIIVASVQVVGTTLGAAVIDKLGRKPLLLLSGIFMAISEVGLGKTPCILFSQFI